VKISQLIVIDHFVLIVNFGNHFDKALTKKLVTQGLSFNPVFIPTSIFARGNRISL